jgi:hypothetical protein
MISITSQNVRPLTSLMSFLSTCCAILYHLFLSMLQRVKHLLNISEGSRNQNAANWSRNSILLGQSDSEAPCNHKFFLFHRAVLLFGFSPSV